MINKKYAQPLFMILMSLGMSVIMSGVVVATTTPLIITLIPNDIKIINKGCAYFLLIIINYYLTG